MLSVGVFVIALCTSCEQCFINLFIPGSLGHTFHDSDTQVTQSVHTWLACFAVPNIVGRHVELYQAIQSELKGNVDREQPDTCNHNVYVCMYVYLYRV